MNQRIGKLTLGKTVNETQRGTVTAEGYLVAAALTYSDWRWLRWLWETEYTNSGASKESKDLEIHFG